MIKNTDLEQMNNLKKIFSSFDKIIETLKIFQKVVTLFIFKFFLNIDSCYI